MNDLIITQYITVDKEIAGGVPVFKGTRVAVKHYLIILLDEVVSNVLLESKSLKIFRPV